jgi:rhodanese-related sulfurtransferase
MTALASLRPLSTPLIGFASAMTDELTKANLGTPKGAYAHLHELTLVDCRENYEWQAGRVEGSVHIPLNDIMGGGGTEIDRSKPVVVICRSGNRSELATMMFQARGLDAYNLEGGIEAWVGDGLPIAAPDGSPGRVA